MQLSSLMSNSPPEICSARVSLGKRSKPGTTGCASKQKGKMQKVITAKRVTIEWLGFRPKILLFV